jgi:hypothetical protein
VRHFFPKYDIFDPLLATFSSVKLLPAGHILLLIDTPAEGAVPHIPAISAWRPRAVFQS